MREITGKPCDSMIDVRREIDRVDRDIVSLLLERLEYIKAAGRIKSDRSLVRDDARVEDVIAKVRAAAADYGGDEGYIEDIYRHLVEWSIRHEFGVWDVEHKA